MEKRIRMLSEIIPILILVSLFALLTIGCDDDDTVSNNPAEVVVDVVLGEDTTHVNIASLSTVDFEGSQVVSLENIINSEIVPLVDGISDTRLRYCFRFFASDGFCPFDRGREDLCWEIYKQGYISPESRNSVYPADLGLPGAYNTVDLTTIKLFQKIDIDSPLGLEFKRVGDLNVHSVDTDDYQNTPAVKLENLLPDSILTLGPENYDYMLHTLDENSLPANLNWEELQSGYYLLGYDITWFDDDNLSSDSYKLPLFNRIEIIE